MSSDEIDTTYLPDAPNEWGRDIGGFRQRWAPGTFGDRETIDDVLAFKVIRNEWDWDAEIPGRTILEAQIEAAA